MEGERESERDMDRCEDTHGSLGQFFANQTPSFHVVFRFRSSSVRNELGNGLVRFLKGTEGEISLQREKKTRILFSIQTALSTWIHLKRSGGRAVSYLLSSCKVVVDSPPPPKKYLLTFTNFWTTADCYDADKSRFHYQ